MENAEINFIPLINFDGRGLFCLRLSYRWLRYSGRMRRLGGSYTTVPLLMKLWLRLRLEGSMGLSVGRHIRSGRSYIRLAKVRRGNVRLQRRRLRSGRVLRLLLGMMERRRMGRRRVDAEELYLVRQSPNCVLKVSNGRLIKILTWVMARWTIIKLTSWLRIDSLCHVPNSDFMFDISLRSSLKRSWCIAAVC